jgi:hypothetical protein
MSESASKFSFRLSVGMGAAHKNTLIYRLTGMNQYSVRTVISVEQVGSRSVPGLAAKPIIDMNMVVASADVKLAVGRLATLGYARGGDSILHAQETFLRKIFPMTLISTPLEKLTSSWGVLREAGLRDAGLPDSVPIQPMPLS